MLIVGQDHSGGGWGRVKEGEQVATMKAKDSIVGSVAVSKDGRFIAAQSAEDVLVWDTTTYKQVFASDNGWDIWDVDFSLDSSRLVSADGGENTTTIWDIAAKCKHSTMTSTKSEQPNTF